MTNEKVLQVINYYQRYLLGRGYHAIRSDLYKLMTASQARNHILWMIPEMREFISAGRMEKAFRWLGCVQGMLMMCGDFTFNDVKNHSRGDIDLIPKE